MHIKILPDLRNSKPHAFQGKHAMFSYDVPEVPPAVRVKMAKAKNIIVIGIGGSTLPLKVLLDASELNDRVHIVDTIDPARWGELKNLEEPLYCVVSKSGETLEVKTLMAELVIGNLLTRTITVTDPERGSLRKWTYENELLSLEIPSDLGGRFTNFTVFHRAVLERFDVDFNSILSGAKTASEGYRNDSQVLESLFQQTFHSEKENLVLWTYGKKLEGLGSWAQQAIAESLGKKTANGTRVGIFPIVLKGPQDQHSVLQLLTDGPQRNCLWFFVPPPSKTKVQRKLSIPLEDLNRAGPEQILNILADSTIRTFEERLENTETLQPLSRFVIDGLEDLGAAIATVQAYVEYCGERLGINAFDQPGVERGKQIARELLKNL